MKSKTFYDIWTSPNSGIGGDGSDATVVGQEPVRIELGNKRGFALVDAEDEAMVRAAGPWRIKVKKSRSNLYAQANAFDLCNKRTVISMHKFIVGPTGELEIHHINFDGLDNRRENLEVLTSSEHRLKHAQQRRKDNTSGVAGVAWDKRIEKWVVRIWFNGKRIYVGGYSDKDEAIAARMKALRSVRAGIHPRTGERIVKVLTT